jgi:hypothetical protein
LERTNAKSSIDFRLLDQWRRPVPFSSSNTKNDSNLDDFWDQVFARFHAADVPDDFMRERPMNEPVQTRDIFGEGKLIPNP